MQRAEINSANPSDTFQCFWIFLRVEQRKNFNAIGLYPENYQVIIPNNITIDFVFCAKETTLRKTFIKRPDRNNPVKEINPEFFCVG